MPCSVENCTGPVLALGFCNRHYRRFKRHGIPTGGGSDRGIEACTIDGCANPVLARTWCRTHYSRWESHGDPLRGPRTLAERFWEKVDKRGPDECWPWTGASGGGDGRGHIWGDGRIVIASRLSVELATGQAPPEERNVLHSCDNPPCVNPRHLRIGTQAENVQDMVSRGRARGGADGGWATRRAKAASR